MSVSDVLEIKNDNGSEFLYCNPFEFETIKFDKEKAMKPIVNHDFQKVNITRINKRVYFFDENDMLHTNCTVGILPFSDADMMIICWVMKYDIALSANIISKA